MSLITENSTGFKSFTATAVAIAAHVRVVLGSGGTISVAGATDIGIGWTTMAIPASGTGTVHLAQSPGTIMVTAAGVISMGQQLFAAAAGRVDNSGAYALKMMALDASTAAGDIIEAVYIPCAVNAVQDFGATETETIAAAGANQGAGTAVGAYRLTLITASNSAKGVTLPVAVKGDTHTLVNTVAAQTVLVYPGSGDDLNDGTTNVHLTLAANGIAHFVAVDTTTWAASGVLS